MTLSEYERRLGFVVPRETYERLVIYVDLLAKWTRAINLISERTASDIWERHVVDCAQILCHRPAGVKKWVDVGSGGGLPGLIVASHLRIDEPAAQVLLVESDKRKSAFLSQAVREMAVNATVITDRIEDIAPMAADVVSARAFASLPELFDMTFGHVSKTGCFLLLKGASVGSELSVARKKWRFVAEVFPSITFSEGAVLRISKLSFA